MQVSVAILFPTTNGMSMRAASSTWVWHWDWCAAHGMCGLSDNQQA